MKKISITTPCFNEAGNIKLLSEAIANVAAKEKDYVFEHIFIDNASTDTTIAEIQSMIDVFPHIAIWAFISLSETLLGNVFLLNSFKTVLKKGPLKRKGPSETAFRSPGRC